MPVTGLTATYLSGDLYRVAWSMAGGSTAVVYRNGSEALRTLAEEAILALDDGDVLDVVLDGETPADAYPRRATLFWWAVSGADRYQVDELVGLTWTRRAVVTDDGTGHFSWSSRVLEDETLHQFRVAALDAAGNASTADAVTLYMVRHPDAPAVTYSIVTVGDYELISEGGDGILSEEGDTLESESSGTQLTIEAA